LPSERLEVGAQQPGLVAQHQVLERIEHVLGDALHLLITGKHQRQLLLEHQHARWNRRHDVEAGVHQLEQLRDVVLLEAGHRRKIAELELGHAAAALLAASTSADAVVLEHRRQVLRQLGFIAIAIAGGKQHHLAAGIAAGLCRQIAPQGCASGAGARCASNTSAAARAGRPRAP
jgi:hypothetical protein